MFTGLNTSVLSFREKMTGWLPSVSLPSVGWDSCKKAFSSLKNQFRSSPNPISEKKAVNLTETLVQGASKNEASNKRRVIVVVVASSCMAVAYGCFRYFQSVSNPSVARFPVPVVQDLEVRVANTFASFLAGSLEHVSRKLLSLVPLALASNGVCSLVGREQVPFSQTFNMWDYFPAQKGRLVPLTTDPIPPGLQLALDQIQIIKSLTVTNTKPTASFEGALYLASATSNTLTMYSADPTLPNINVPKGILDAGNVIKNMIVSGEQLITTGVGTLMKIFDISQPFNPEFRGQVLNATRTGNAIATTGGNQFGSLSTNGFSYLDGINFNETGLIPGLSGTVMTASESCYYVATSTALLSLSAAPSSSSLSSLPISGINSIIYRNGYCLAGTISTFYVIQCLPNGLMNIVLTLPLQIWSMFASGDLLYYTNFSPGLNIMDISNITNPRSPPSASSLLTEMGSIGEFIELKDESGVQTGLGVKTNLGFYYVKRQDSFTISGTPTGGSQGNYPFTLRGRTFSGSEISDTKACSMTVLPAINTPTPIQKFIAVINELFNAIIPASAFQHVHGSAMAYALSCNAGTRGISLNPNGQFSGTPMGTEGIINCNVRATDNSGSSATSNNFDIQFVSRLALTQISSQLATIDVPFVLDLNAIAQGPISITVSNLPPSFILSNGVISGTPTDADQGTRLITVTITESGIPTPTTLSFSLNVGYSGDPRFAQALQPPAASTTYYYEYTIPDNLAVNPTNPTVPITYTAALNDGSPLPAWLSFDGRKFSGTPPIGANRFVTESYTIILTATQELANKKQVFASTVLVLSVGGMSILWTVSAVLSAAGLGRYVYGRKKDLRNKLVRYPCLVTGYNKIKSVFSRCGCKPTRFITGSEDYIEGHSIEYTFKTDALQIDWFKCFYNDKPCPPGGELPNWMEVIRVSTDVVKIVAKHVPPMVDVKSIKIVAKDKNDYYLEERIFNKSKAEAYSRPCRTVAGTIEQVKFYSVDLTNKTERQVPSLSGLSYDKISNRVLADKMPTEPIIVRIFAERDVEVETIYMNIAPSDRFREVTDDGKDDAKAPLIAATTAAAVSPLSVDIELADRAT